MKSIMLSIQPKWVEKILSGEKTIEIRKTAPKCKLSVEVYIYCTKATNKRFTLWQSKLRGGYRYLDDRSHNQFDYSLNGNVVAKFTLNNVEKFSVPYPAFFIEVEERLRHITDDSCLTLSKLHRYLKNKSGSALHIDNLQVFDKPRELREFKVKCKDWHDGMSGCDDVCGLYENGKCRNGYRPLSKPPQSWCYVEVAE